MLLAKPRILCVDDEDCREMLDLMLNLAEPVYEFAGADSADKALKMIEDEKFDLYLFEYRLPEMSGIELCRQIRKIDAETPILFFTGMARPVDRNQAMAAGATEYLVKPNDLDRLAETIKRLLHKSLSISKPESANSDEVHHGIY